MTAWGMHNGVWVKPGLIPARHQGIIKPVRNGFARMGGAWLQVYRDELVRVVAPGSVSIVLSQYFSAAEWADPNAKKRLIIPAGVEVTAANLSYVIASTLSAAGQAGSWAGQLAVDNYGILSGRGGILGAGGDVILGNFKGRDGQKLKLTNKPGGIIRAGGGRGGNGGQGGPGYYQTPYTYTEGPYYDNAPWNTYGWASDYAQQGSISSGVVYWASSIIAYNSGGLTSVSSGGWLYVRGALAGSGWTGGDNSNEWYVWQIYRQQTRYNTYYTTGGLGGAGGRGRGCDGPQAGGLSGSAGSTNAGAGNAGGNGGDWGLPGGNGLTGAGGNNGAGSAGAAGSLAGCALNGIANIDFVNEPGGVVLGRIV